MYLLKSYIIVETVNNVFVYILVGYKDYFLMQEVIHIELAEQFEKALKSKNYVTRIDTSHLEMSYPPIIQSGSYTLIIGVTIIIIVIVTNSALIKKLSTENYCFF